jgi:hypothetical protein
VLAAINFHDQPPAQTGEVDDEISDRNLAAKLDAKRVETEVPPKVAFRVGHRLPQAAGDGG